jgi:D-alanine transaminase
MIVYFNGRFIPKEDVKISPDDRGFLFADGAYEVIRSYGGRLFKTEEHLERLERSLTELLISVPSLINLRTVAEQLINRNNLENGDATLYIQVTRGVAPRRHEFPDKGISTTVYVVASPFQPLIDKWENGTNIVLVPDIRWERCNIKSVALLPNVLASQLAKDKGAFEAIFVRDGTITEGSHTNFCAVFDGQLVTHPANHCILAGITRKVVLNLCYKLEIPFRELPILEKDLRKASELMILGTTSEILPVVQVDGWMVGDGKPGPITAKLQQAYRKLATAL